MKRNRSRVQHTLYVLIGLFFLIATAGQMQPAAAQTEVSDRDKRVHYSLYYENFKNDNFEAALPDLKWILANAPAFPSEDDRNFDRIVEAYVGLAEAASGEEQQRTYLDSALVYIERAVPVLEEAGAEVNLYEWRLRKGRLIQTHNEVLEDRRDEMIAAYEAAYQAAPDEIDPYYLERILRAFVLNEDKQGAIAFMEELRSTRGEEDEVDEILDEWGDRIFTGPEERIAYLEGRLEDEPNNTEAMTELFDLYTQTNQRNEASRLANRLLETDPSPRIYRTVAQMRLEDNEPQKAFELYEQAVELAGDSVSAQIYYNMGIAQQQLEQYSRARTYFRQAVDVDPNFGRAYLAIGDLYARAVSQCGANQMQPTDQAVYWLATDYYQRASSADPSIENAANRKISTYRQYFPSTETLFFEGWEVGQSFSIDYGCYAWIGETTTVKAS